MLSTVRAKLGLLVLGLILPAALLVHLFASKAGQALLAQHPGPQPGSGHALLGQELLALSVLLGLAIAATWFGSRLFVVRGDRALLSAADRSAASPRPHGGGGRGGGTGDTFPFVAHDLRSALTSIKAASTLMLEHGGALGEKGKREMLETIRDGADGLDRLITNAVQLSRSRAGRLVPRRIPAAVDDVASRTLERLRHTLRDHRVVVVIPEDLPDVRIDVVLLEQAIGNLLENAARLTPPGTEIALSVLRKGGSVVVRVEDRGPGIRAHERQGVSEPISEVSAGGGAGLRLPISRAIAEAHGGRLTVDGAEGGGTSVLLELPLEDAAAVPGPGPEGAP